MGTILELPNKPILKLMNKIRVHQLLSLHENTLISSKNLLPLRFIFILAPDFTKILVQSLEDANVCHLPKVEKLLNNGLG